MEILSNPIKIAIADDHKILRNGLISSLSKFSDLRIDIEASDGDELLAKMNIHPVDVLLLDIKMPKMDGIEVVKHIRKTDDKIIIIILTMHDDDGFIIKLINAKANAYLVKNSDPEEIRMAIYSCISNGYYYNDLVKEVLARNVARKNNNLSSTTNARYLFDERELEVLQLICREKTSAEIGKLIFLSTRTIDGIRAKLMEKTNTKNIAGLVIFCFRNNLFNE